MQVSSITHNRATKTGKTAGTLIGTGVASGYIAKNYKDIFIERGKEAAQTIGNKKIGYLIAAGVSAAIVGLSAIGGRIIGGITGKIIDNHNAKKAAIN